MQVQVQMQMQVQGQAPAQASAQASNARGAAGLLTVRSGPDGGQLALVTADPAQPQGLRVAALGDTVGGCCSAKRKAAAAGTTRW